MTFTIPLNLSSFRTMYWVVHKYIHVMVRLIHKVSDKDKGGTFVVCVCFFFSPHRPQPKRSGSCAIFASQVPWYKNSQWSEWSHCNSTNNAERHYQLPLTCLPEPHNLFVIHWMPYSVTFFLIIKIKCVTNSHQRSCHFILSTDLAAEAQTSTHISTRSEKYFPGGSVVKNLPTSARDPGSIPRSGRSPGEGLGNPLQQSCLENSMDRGA